MESNDVLYVLHVRYDPVDFRVQQYLAQSNGGPRNVYICQK